MPQMHCNFFSYSLGHGVDLTITLPGVSPCDMDDPALLTGISVQTKLLFYYSQIL